MELLIILAVIVVLIAFNALYVAAEFSAVSVRRARLAQASADGNALATYMLETVESPARLDTFVAACQIGITVSSLVLGGYGNSQLLALAAPFVSTLEPATQVIVNTAITVSVLFVLTVLQVILGELTPKNIALQFPEALSLLTVRPMVWSIAAFRPLIAITNGSGSFLMRLVGLSAVAEHVHVHSPDEIRILVEESSAGGVLDEEERRLLVNTLELRNLNARKVMIPRTHMLAEDVTTPLATLFQILADSNFSRIPVYNESVDAIVGVVHLKDLVEVLFMPAPDTLLPQKTVRDIMHPVLFVPDTVEVGDVMQLMQQERKNLVVVVDEYGGTAGMITFEDLLEEIIGEFQDEYDVENPPMELRPNRRLRIRGDVLLEQVNDILETAFVSEDVDTMGGLVFSELGHIPEAGETVILVGRELRVDRLQNNAVEYVSMLLTPEEATEVATRLKLIG
ncbi:MAG: hemolysin family protein [Litorilinea sp.]